MMVRERGMMIYTFYRALTYALSPLLRFHLRWRRYRGLEHRSRWTERLGCPSLPRPRGSLLWFHAVSLGEGMAAIPVIKRCIQERPDLNILMTTTALSAFEILKNELPSHVIYQFAPVDVPAVMDAFLEYWRPNVVVLMESELWPNLIMNASKRGITLSLINARISTTSLKRWLVSLVFPLMSLMLSKFTLIIPLSMKEAVHFQLLQAPPMIVSFSADLKFSVQECNSVNINEGNVENIQKQLAHRKVWVASSLHKGEEEVMLGAHDVLVQRFPNILTILVPRHPQHAHKIVAALRNQGKNVAIRSHGDKLKHDDSIYLVDTLGELRNLYKITPIAVVGGSFMPGLAGHNVSEAAAAGCAVLTGPHIGHFYHMVSTMQHLNPLAILQVSGKVELVDALMELHNDINALEARRSAAKQAYYSLSSGIVSRVWNLLNQNVIGRL